MSSQVQRYPITWNDIQIRITYTRNISEVIDHIGIESLKPEKAPLPMTETGYKSHYVLSERMDQYDSPSSYVIEWLNHKAKSKEWIQYEFESKQYSLF